MAQLAKILRAHAQKRRPIDLGIAADIIMDARMERLAVFIKPCFLGRVFAIGKNRAGIPVVFFLGKKRTAFQDQYAFAGRRQGMGQGTAPGACTDNNNIVMIRIYLMLNKQ